MAAIRTCLKLLALCLLLISSRAVRADDDEEDEEGDADAGASGTVGQTPHKKRDFAGADKGLGARMLRGARRVNIQQAFYNGEHNSADQHGNLQPASCHETSTEQEAAQIRLMAWQYDDAFFSLLQSFAAPDYISPILGGACPDPACIHPKRAPLKGLPRMIWKLNGKYNTMERNGCQDVTDIVRGSLIFHKAGDICKFVKALGEGKSPGALPEGIVKIEVANVKHRMRSKTPKTGKAELDDQDVGYKDMLVNIKMYKDLEGKDFHVAELQVHLAGMIEAKSNGAKGGHLMYRVIRQQQEVIDGKGTKSKFGAGQKNFDTDKDWDDLVVIKEIPGKADPAKIQEFLPDADVKAIADEFKISAAWAQVTLARRNSRKVYLKAWDEACANPEDPGGCACLQSLNCNTPAFHVKGNHVKTDLLKCAKAGYTGDAKTSKCCDADHQSDCFFDSKTMKCYTNNRHEAWENKQVFKAKKMKSERYERKPTQCSK